MPDNYVLLKRLTLTQNTASVDLNNIPQSGYTDLKLVVSARGTTNQIYTLTDIWFNGETSGFSSRGLEGSGTAATTYTNPSIYFNAVQGATAPANTFSNNTAYIPNYTSNKHKSVLVEGVLENTTSEAYASMQTGIWTSTASINSIQIKTRADVFTVGSTFSVYGVAALGTDATRQAKASGGDIVISDGTHWYHAFLGSSVFKPFQTLSCDVLVVAGGGSGGNFGGAGGGAGGLLALTSQSISTAQTVTIGAGGAGVVPSGRQGNSGSNSVFGSSTATGGGGGGAESSNGKNGGSGGGAGGGAGGAGTGTGGTAVSGQGFAGGAGGGASGGGAGGGGAGAVGANGTSGETGGNGGIGSNAYSTWASVTGTGASGYYAGGGGGATGTGVGGGTGGAGGGTGGHSGTDATANTGGGGGGRWNSATSSAGGSGIVIVRYPVAS
jgi:hypothetical protein